MIALSLCAYAFEEVVQWRYGTAGFLAIALITVGHKFRNTMFTAIGLTAIAVLLVQ